LARKLTEEERPDNGQGQKVSDSETEFQQLENRKSELVGEIGQGEKETSDSISNLIECTDKAIADHKKETESFQSYERKVEAGAIDALDKTAEKARRVVNSVLTYFRIYVIIVITLLATIGAIGGYLFIVYIPAQGNNFFITWIVLSIVVLVILWLEQRALSETDLNKEVMTQTSKLMQVASSRPQRIHDLSPLKRLTVAATNGIRRVTTSALELIPTTGNIIRHQNTRAKQQQFVENFTFALQRYGIDASNEAKQVMMTKSWLLDNVHGWLKDISREMSSIFSVDPVVFQLIYYEFFDDKFASKLWNEILFSKTQEKQSEEIRKQISRILIERELISTPDKEKSLLVMAQLLGKMPRYSLEEAKARAHNFFSELAKFKDACRSHLDFYGLRIVEKEALLSEHVPQSPDVSNWRDDVMSFIAEQILSRRPIDIKLLILSAEGDQDTTKTWTDILDSGKLEELASILTLKRIRPEYNDFRNVFLFHLKLAMTHNRDEFSLAGIDTSVEALESEILNTKYRIRHAITEYRLSPIELDFINSFVPSDISSVETELLGTLSKKLEIDDQIFSLIYYSANGMEKAQEIYEEMRDKPKIGELATLLVEKSFIMKTKFSANTTLLLRTQPSFSLNSFVSVYVRYESLFERLDAFYPFLNTNGVLTSSSPLELPEVLVICPPHINNPPEYQLLEVASRLVTKTIGETILDEEQHRDLALASTAMFMRVHGYSGYAPLCQEASRRKFATRVLFQYITLAAEQRLSGARETMKIAVMKALQGIIDEVNFEYFKSELADGNLAPSADFLTLQFKRDVKTELKNLQEKGFETQILENYLDPIRVILYESINEKVVREFLLNQVLSAYLLTVPGLVPGISFLEEGLDYIRRAEKELASSRNDPRYINMVQLSKGGGKATRIGLVPLELTFEDFSTKFDEVWSLAVKLYNGKAEGHKIQDPLPCYVIRVFPSEDGLKEIMPSADIKIRPLEVIRQLIKDSASSEDSLSLLSFIQRAPSGKSALFRVIQDIFDNKKSTLKMMIADHADILAKSQILTRKFEKKEVDNDLLHVYQVQLISKLGKRIAEHTLEVGEAVAMDEFREHIGKAMGNKTELTIEETEKLVRTIFKRLQSIGFASLN